MATFTTPQLLFFQKHEGRVSLPSLLVLGFWLVFIPASSVAGGAFFAGENETPENKLILKMAINLLQKGDFGVGAEKFRGLLKGSPKSPQGLWGAAYCQFQVGDIKESFATFSRIGAGDIPAEFRPAYYWNLAVYSAYLGDREKALRLLKGKEAVAAPFFDRYPEASQSFHPKNRLTWLNLVLPDHPFSPLRESRITFNRLMQEARKNSIGESERALLGILFKKGGETGEFAVYQGILDQFEKDPRATEGLTKELKGALAEYFEKLAVDLSPSMNIRFSLILARFLNNQVEESGSQLAKLAKKVAESPAGVPETLAKRIVLFQEFFKKSGRVIVNRITSERELQRPRVTLDKEHFARLGIEVDYKTEDFSKVNFQDKEEYDQTHKRLLDKRTQSPGDGTHDYNLASFHLEHLKNYNTQDPLCSNPEFLYNSVDSYLRQATVLDPFGFNESARRELLDEAGKTLSEKREEYDVYAKNRTIKFFENMGLKKVDGQWVRNPKARQDGD